jgi:Ca-activated chloride channel homolog
MPRTTARRAALPAALITACLLAACGGAPAASPSQPLSGSQAGGNAAAAPTAAPAMPAPNSTTSEREAISAPLSAAPAPTAAAAADSAVEATGAPIAQQPVEVNPFTPTVADQLSTFALDVDTASYSAARGYIESGALPPPELVRVEEFLNAFDYRYPQPSDTFGITIDSAPAPFGQPGTQLVRVGIQGKTIEVSQRKDAMLTFVVDISGSMADANRLPLVKQALSLLVEQLRGGDKVAIVVYGDSAATVLEPTSIADKGRILAAIDSLQNEGSTNAEAGLKMAYELAGRAFMRDGINRVILCSDGVANVGQTGPEEILRSIRDAAEQGIYLTTVGFGMDDYNDYLMEQLANDGNGSYAYVDDIDEAKRIFVENLTGTLQVIAKDTKVQVVFNPEVVSQYRLLGYENRAVADTDFRNDKVDAGEIGAGHSVTALYEVVLTEQGSGEALNVQLRWADPDSGEVRELAQPFASTAFGDDLAAAAPELRLAIAVAAFAEQLRGSAYAADRPLSEVRELVAGVAQQLANDPAVQELLNLVTRAEQLAG